jgi:drug/metabolite transporter (DMT)-like permease
MAALAFVFESDQWQAPNNTHWFSILYNAILVFGFAQPAWFYLARNLPPLASTLSVMMIPILAVFAGAAALNELLHWQDWAATVLVAIAIGSVLWPTQSSLSIASAEKKELEGQEL